VVVWRVGSTLVGHPGMLCGVTVISMVSVMVFVVCLYSLREDCAVSHNTMLVTPPPGGSRLLAENEEEEKG
jgi:hypothetical protein